MSALLPESLLLRRKNEEVELLLTEDGRPARFSCAHTLRHSVNNQKLKARIASISAWQSCSISPLQLGIWDAERHFAPVLLLLVPNAVFTKSRTYVMATQVNSSVDVFSPVSTSWSELQVNGNVQHVSV